MGSTACPAALNSNPVTVNFLPEPEQHTADKLFAELEGPSRLKSSLCMPGDLCLSRRMGRVVPNCIQWQGSESDNFQYAIGGSARGAWCVEECKGEGGVRPDELCNWAVGEPFLISRKLDGPAS